MQDARCLKVKPREHAFKQFKSPVLNVLTNVTLASSNCTLPDDGDNTETCWNCFNVNFNILLKQLFCASVGNKTLISDLLSEVSNLQYHSKLCSKCST